MISPPPQSDVTPRPIDGLLGQTGFDWVVLDVADYRFKVRLVTDVGIPVVLSPERSCTAQDAIRHSRRKPLPGTDDVLQAVTCEGFDQHVHMVGLDVPGD